MRLDVPVSGRARLPRDGACRLGILLAAALILAGSGGCRKILTRYKVEEFRKCRTFAVAWEIRGRTAGPALYEDTIERILGHAGLRRVDPGEQAPDLLVHIELRGSYTYRRPKPGDWWDSGEVSLLGPGGKLYFRHFYGDEEDAPASFYAEPESFYEEFLLMTSRVWGRRVAEEEVRALSGDPRFGEAPRRILRRLQRERRRSWEETGAPLDVSSPGSGGVSQDVRT